MTANVSLKQAVIGVEGFLIGTQDVEKLAEFLLGLIAIFNVDHVCCVGREHTRSMASFAKTLFEKWRRAFLLAHLTPPIGLGISRIIEAALLKVLSSYMYGSRGVTDRGTQDSPNITRQATRTMGWGATRTFYGPSTGLTAVVPERGNCVSGQHDRRRHPGGLAVGRRHGGRGVRAVNRAHHPLPVKLSLTRKRKKG